MEDIYDTQLHLQNLQNELEFLKKIKNVEVARREHLEMQFRKVRQEIEQCKADRITMQDQLHQSQQQTRKLDAELLRLQQKNKNLEHQEYDTIDQIENPESDESDDSDIEILEILPKPKLVIHDSPIKSPQLNLQHGNTNNNMSRTEGCSSVAPNSVRAESAVEPLLFRFRTADSVTVSRIGQSSGPKPIVAACKSANFFPAKNSAQSKSPGAQPASKYRIVDIDSISPNGSESSSPGKLSKNQDTCSYCGVQLDIANLKSHIAKIHRSPVSSWWICSLCTKEYSCGHTLKCHYNADHGNIRYACGICNALFQSAASAKFHRKTQHDLNETLPTQQVLKRISK